MEGEDERGKSGYRNVDYQVDTLNASSGAAGYYSPSKNSITVNYVKEQDNTYALSDEVIAHEQKHRDNESKGLWQYAISPEQAYKLNMHNEISANMAELFSLRQKYIQTGDISVLNVFEFSFYADAVASGKVNPLSTDKEDFGNEMRFITNGVQQYWCSKYAIKYMDHHISNALYYGERSRKHEAFYNENYERAKKICYNIGGVDLTQYMERDVDIPIDGALKLRDKLKRRGIECLNSESMAHQLDLPAYDGQMSLQQYQDLVQQTLAMNKAFDLNAPGMTVDGKPIRELKKINLAYRTLNPSQYSEKEKERYQKAMQDVLPVAQDITTVLAKEYCDKGLAIGQGDDEAYEDALKKLYVYSYDSASIGGIPYQGEVDVRNLLQADGQSYTSEISSKAQSYINPNKWDVVRRRVAYLLPKYKEFERKTTNEPVRTVNNNEPEYRKWHDKDGERVSAVQHREILDMNQPFLQKPNEDEMSKPKTAEEIALEKSGRRPEHPKYPVSKISDAPSNVLMNASTRQR